MYIDIVQLAAFLGVPTAVTGLCFWLLRRRIDRREDERAEIERARNCNGDMSDALHYAAQVKHSQKDFLTKQGIEHLHTD